VVEAEEGGLWVVKFRGAGQGARALIAEVLLGELARELGLPVPPLAEIHVPESLGRLERDPEIQDLLKASRGINIGIRYLEGAFNFDPVAAGDFVSTDLATRIVWFDALVLNPDRSPRNPNLMIHAGAPWLIDHGAALFHHFDWARVDRERSQAPSPRIAEHVLLPRAASLLEPGRTPSSGAVMAAVDRALARIPDALLEDPLLVSEFPSVTAHRARYRTWFETRMEPGPAGVPRFVEGAEAARLVLRDTPPAPLAARR
jgi:hypothetical protein